MKTKSVKAAVRRRKPKADWTSNQLPAHPSANNLHDFEPLTLPSDPLNRQIISMLQEDGRLPYATIAQALNTSEGTVRNRVNRMIQSRVLKIIAVADPLALGYTGYAMLGLKFATGAHPDTVATRFRERSEVTYVLLVGGRYDLLIEVICETQKQLRDFILETCYGKPDISSVEAMMALTTYKNLLKWGQP